MTTFYKIFVYLIAGILIWYGYTTISSTSRTIGYHVDEWTTADRTRFLYYFLNLDLTNQDWQSVDSYDQPLFAFYLYGIYFRLQGITNLQEYLNTYNFYQGTNEPFKTSWVSSYSSNPPVKELPPIIHERIKPILSLRAVAVFFSVLTICIILLNCFLFKNEAYGVICLGLLVFNTNYINLTSRAMNEPILIFFFNLALLVTLLLNLTNSIQKRIFLLIVLGIVAGFSFSIKLNGIITILFGMIISSITLKKTIFLSIFSPVVILCIAFGIFYILNPFIWGSPIKNTRFIWNYRFEQFNNQQIEFSQRALTSPLERILRTNEKLFFGNERYTTLSQISRVPLDYFFWCIGLFFLLMEHLNIKDKIKKERIIQFFIYILLLTLFTILFIPLDWDRYYLPLVFCIIYIEGFGIFQLISLSYNLLLSIRNIGRS
jgi:hypothetical protein